MNTGIDPSVPAIHIVNHGYFPDGLDCCGSGKYLRDTACKMALDDVARPE